MNASGDGINPDFRPFQDKEKGKGKDKGEGETDAEFEARKAVK